MVSHVSWGHHYFDWKEFMLSKNLWFMLSAFCILKLATWGWLDWKCQRHAGEIIESLNCHRVRKGPWRSSSPTPCPRQETSYHPRQMVIQSFLENLQRCGTHLYSLGPGALAGVVCNLIQYRKRRQHIVTPWGAPLDSMPGIVLTYVMDTSPLSCNRGATLTWRI